MKLIVLILFVLLSFKGISQSLETLIDSIVNQLSLEEKIEQISRDGFFNTKANTKLGINGFNMSDGPHGYTLKTSTSFPQTIANVCTWDPNDWYNLGKAMSNEFVYNNSNVQLAPCLDLSRDPRNGRSAESVGEDPLLGGIYGEQVVKGIQSNAVVAVIKHLIGTNKENNRMTANIKINDDVFEEIYGLPFKRAIQEGGAFGVMSSFNMYNGEYSSENKRLLDTLLRKNWGFPFFTVSDWGSIKNTKNALLAGTDLCMGSTNYEKDIPVLLKQQQITEDDIDKLLRRVLKTKLISGLNDYHVHQKNNIDSNQKLALKIAQKSIVLLKNNDGILPLTKNLKIAVIGPSADIVQLDGFGSSVVTPSYTISPLKGIQSKALQNKILYTKGCDINSIDTTDFNNARNLAKEVDVVLFFGGLDATMEGEGFGSGGDRKNGKAELPDNQLLLIQELAKINKNIIVVVQSGGVCTIGNTDSLIKGLLYAFYPGMEGGQAIADILFGDVNPSGKLCVTIPKATNQLPTWNDSFNDDYGHGYRYFEQTKREPLYAFGSGKSYSKFKISNLLINKKIIDHDSVNIQVDIQNINGPEGEEIIQAYIQPIFDKTKTKKLISFKRVNLKPNEKKTINLKFHTADIFYYNIDKKHIETKNGQYILSIGNSINSIFEVDTIHIELQEQPKLEQLNLFSYPRFPTYNDSVYYYVSLKNQGNKSILKNETISISIEVDGKQTISNDYIFNNDLIPGGSVFVPVTPLPFKFESVGMKKINITTKYISNNSEKTYYNQIYSDSLNLASGKVILSKTNNHSIETIIDKETNNYWESSSDENQWILVDLNTCFNVRQINLNWRKNFAKEMYILGGISPEMMKDTVYNTTNGYSNSLKINSNFKTRFLKIVFTKKGDKLKNYQISNLSVYGDSLNECFDLNKPFFNAFPNPTFDYIYFNQKIENQSIISIFDLYGKCIYEEPKSKESIDIRHLNDGIYIIKIIEPSGNIKTTKISKISK